MSRFGLRLAGLVVFACAVAAIAASAASSSSRSPRTTPPAERILNLIDRVQLARVKHVVVVYEEVVAGRVRQGVPAFVATLALVVPLTIVFARGFASVFEIPFRQHRSGRVCGARELSRERSHPADSGTSSVCAPLRAFVTR